MALLAAAALAATIDVVYDEVVTRKQPLLGALPRLRRLRDREHHAPDGLAGRRPLEPRRERRPRDGRLRLVRRARGGRAPRPRRAPDRARRPLLPRPRHARASGRAARAAPPRLRPFRDLARRERARRRLAARRRSRRAFPCASSPSPRSRRRPASRRECGTSGPSTAARSSREPPHRDHRRPGPRLPLPLGASLPALRPGQRVRLEVETAHGQIIGRAEVGGQVLICRPQVARRRRPSAPRRSPRGCPRAPARAGRGASGTRGRRSGGRSAPPRTVPERWTRWRALTRSIRSRFRRFERLVVEARRHEPERHDRELRLGDDLDPGHRLQLPGRVEREVELLVEVRPETRRAPCSFSGSQTRRPRKSARELRRDLAVVDEVRVLLHRAAGSRPTAAWARRSDLGVAHEQRAGAVRAGRAPCADRGRSSRRARCRPSLRARAPSAGRSRRRPRRRGTRAAPAREVRERAARSSTAPVFVVPALPQTKKGVRPPRGPRRSRAARASTRIRNRPSDGISRTLLRREPRQRAPPSHRVVRLVGDVERPRQEVRREPVPPRRDDAPRRWRASRRS